MGVRRSSAVSSPRAHALNNAVTSAGRDCTSPNVVSRLSPDGTRIALDMGVTELAIWMWDTRRATLTRLNGDPGSQRQPVWTADGERIIFWSERGGAPNLYWQKADGSDAVEALFPTPAAQFPYSVS